MEKYAGSSFMWKSIWPDHALIIVLSNVHLDDARILEMLDIIFSGYDLFDEITFVLMGDFSSEPVSNPYKFQILFKKLLGVIESHPNLKENARWILIPGPRDPGLGQFMPRQKLPEILTSCLEVLPHFKSKSNPTRV